jgi:hypothetical protein
VKCKVEESAPWNGFLEWKPAVFDPISKFEIGRLTSIKLGATIE